MLCRCKLQNTANFSKKICFFQKRFKQGPNHWSSLRKNQSPKYKALQYFDDFYKNIYNKKWPSIRLGLLCDNKHIAVLNNFSDTERVQSMLENEGAMNLKTLVELQPKLPDKIREKSAKLRRSLSTQIEAMGEQMIDEEKENLYSGQAPETPELSDRVIDPQVDPHSRALYEFIPASKLKGKEDWVPESTHFSYYDSVTDFPVTVEKEPTINFPDALKVFTFEMGNTSRFPNPRRGSTQVIDYYLMDGGSLLPVLALDLSFGDRVLDVCAAPGGKSLLCHQTLLPEKVVSNDYNFSRTRRLTEMLKDFLFDFDSRLKTGGVEIWKRDARRLEVPGLFNKILVDVPCTTDRHSVNNDDNNMFRPDRVKERIKLPEQQAQMLVSALKLVQVGGSVVYSTCSLSPIQNDGVVQMALRKIWQETDHQIVVKDLWRALYPYRLLYKFSQVGLKYGHLVIPYLPANYGPMYFCKLYKKK